MLINIQGGMTGVYSIRFNACKYNTFIWNTQIFNN